MKRVSIIEVILCVLTVALTVTALIPAVAKIQRTPADAQCQANLKRWAEAMDMYVADNCGVYPTNKKIVNGVVEIYLTPHIALSPDEIDPATGKPMRFTYGLNWVEALYPYLWDRSEKTGKNWTAFLKCPNASSAIYPPDVSYNQRVSYTFNASLAEQPEVLLRKRDNLMVFREFSKVTCAILRPMNTTSIGNAAVKPQYPFLCKTDYAIDTSTECTPHGGGSYIVFADGHVKYFALDYYPEYQNLTAAGSYDPLTAQWYNYVYPNPATDQQVLLNKSIAITP